MEAMPMRSIETTRYTTAPLFKWRMPEKVLSILDLDQICETCDSIKDSEIQKLKKENEKLLSLIEFLQEEIKSFELKTALNEKAISLKEMVKEFTSTPDGQSALQEAFKERVKEWKQLVNLGQMSRIKYYRLIKGMDQKTLADRLGTAQPNISRIERPGYNIPTKTLKQLNKIFRVKKEDLIGD